MKIIKLGNVPDKIEIPKTCNSCRTEFTYNRTDVNSDRDGAYVICPCCNKYIAV